MDPNEIIKHAPDLLKGGAAVAGALKLTDVVKAMLGPATAEIAERFRDDIRLYRYGRQLECLKKAEKMAKDAGFTPKAAPIKLLFPLLEGASLEENEDLHTMWAALLANAASPNKAEMVRPGFITILKQMAPDEANLLKLTTTTTEEYVNSLPSFARSAPALAGRKAYLMLELRTRFNRPEEDESASGVRWYSCVQLLRNVGLIRDEGDIILLSPLGVIFLELCEPPKPES